MFVERLPFLPSHLCGVQVCPTDEVFAALPESVRTRRTACAEAALAAPLAIITASDWRAFFETGDRARYEALYFSRRRRLTDLVCGTLGEPEKAGQYMSAILDTIWAVCEESAWQLPPHNSYTRDAPQLPWPDVTRPVVDLFAAETGALLACTAASLGNRLPEAVHARIQYEIERRILTPYRTTHFWWMGCGSEPMCNWTVWCTQNVLLCAFALPFSGEVRRAVMEQAAHSADFFLKDYGPDGCCSEGAQYYGHAGLCLFGCLELLCAAAPGAFEPLWQEEKIRNIAAYIHHVHISGPYYVNFADCSPCAGRRGAREYAFARRTGNIAMARFAARDWRESLSLPPENSDVARINLWYQLLETQYAEEMTQEAARMDTKAAKSGAPEIAPLPGKDSQTAGEKASLPGATKNRMGSIAASADCAYPSVGVYIARRGAWFLAAKAGNNADSHNHNDTGSVILYRDGRPFLIDIGVETYTKKTFSPQRYDIWTMQSAWHNLPTFDGIMQQPGADFCAREVQTHLALESAEISMELSAAWPAEAHLTRYLRTVRLTAEGLCIDDVCEGGCKEAFLSLMVCEQPVVKNTHIAVGMLGAIEAEGVCGRIEVDTIPITDARLRLAWPETLWRVRIPFDRALMVRVRSAYSNLQNC